jgi:DNA-binding NarL/FixJ family response regulator
MTAHADSRERLPTALPLRAAAHDGRCPEAGDGARPDLVTVTLQDEYEVVSHGVRQMLQPYSGRVTVVEPDEITRVDAQHHVVLFDCYPTPARLGPLPARLRPARARGRVVAYSWETSQECVSEALGHGFDGYLAKSLDGADLASALEVVVASPRPVVVTPSDGDGAGHPVIVWPGDDCGLTAREREVIALICQGVNNAEIAACLHLSINSVKSYIRSAYRKADVASRAQAVLWGLDHGFGPEPARMPGLVPPGRRRG